MAGQLLPKLRRGTSLLLARIGEPSNNDLRLVLLETNTQSVVVDTELGPANPIEPDLTSRGFELTWWRYIAYSIRNESYFKPEDGAVFSPGPVGVVTNSAYLAYIAATTFATEAYPGPLTHWFVNTGWHCVDIVSDAAPEVRELDAEEVLTLIMEDRSRPDEADPGGPIH